MSRKLRRAALSSLAGVVLLDLALSLFAIEDGTFLGWPLPPFGAITNPVQRGHLEAALVAEENPTSVGLFDAELGWSLRPGGRSAEGLYDINSIGSRSRREYSAERPAGATRLLCFGDSYTFCDQIPEEESWPAILEELEPGLEALNFGVGGYGTDQALLRFRRHAPGLDAQVLVMGLLLENIGRNVNRYRPRWHPRSTSWGVKPRFVLDSDGALELVPIPPYADKRDLLESVLDASVLADTEEHDHWLGKPAFPTWLGMSSLARLAAGYVSYRVRDPERLWLDIEGEPARVTLALLETFAAEARTLGARPLVIVFGGAEEILGLAAGEDPYWGGLFAELDRRGIPHVDAIGAVADTHRALRKEGSPASVLYASHLSGVGNRVVARTVLDWLEESGASGGSR